MNKDKSFESLEDKMCYFTNSDNYDQNSYLTNSNNYSQNSLKLDDFD